MEKIETIIVIGIVTIAIVMLTRSFIKKASGKGGGGCGCGSGNKSGCSAKRSCSSTENK